MIMETAGHRSFWCAEMFFLFRAALCRPARSEPENPRFFRDAAWPVSPLKKRVGGRMGAWGEGKPLARWPQPNGGRRPCPLRRRRKLRALTAEIMPPIFTCRYGMCGFWGGWGSLRGNYGNAFPRFAAERLGPFCREQRPDGRPQAVPVRRQRSLTGIDSRAKGFLPPQDK